ncbi:hypothetical protein [Lonepinella sp. BR2474]|uniref:hypothetical protein n=1 Tax=Lonepinella sp. BR2474 TaxID=3434548 RepID=UPI003F6DA657
MKKLLGVSFLAVLLTACTSESNQRPQGPRGERPQNPQLEAAMKSCHESVGQTQDRTKFEACMKEKGFEKPAARPSKPSSTSAN